jgi:hypothetical protein
MGSRREGSAGRLAVVILALLCLSLVSSLAASPNVGRVIGRIENVRFEGEAYYVFGWACQEGIDSSIDVQIYADHFAYDATKGIFVLAGHANLVSEPAVDQVCQAHGGKHRFQIELPYDALKTFQGRKLYVQGIRKQDGVQNAAISRSGELEFPKPPFFRITPNSFPRLIGSYRSSPEHPRVFSTRGELNDLAARINAPGSFSAQSFARLASQVKDDLAGPKDWAVTYSGCNLDAYLHAFSIEPIGGYPNEIHSVEQLSAVLKMKPGTSPPTGAAIVASRLALYAALIRAGAKAPAGVPPADQAADRAKQILMAWAEHGFRDTKGNFLSAATQFCDGQGNLNRVYQNNVGLHVARGVIYTVDAQDLLQSIGALNPAELATLNRFHGAMFELIRQASNFRFTIPELNHPDSVCELYSNQLGAHLYGLLAIARLLDDGRKFSAVLYGADREIPLAVPWIEYFDHVIYGESDKPIACYKNTSPDSESSDGSFQTPIVALGEIEDRYRHHGKGQAFGYTLGVLGGLFAMADIMTNAGFDAYGYRGAHKQSIEMATQYYSCYGKFVGFKKIVTATNGQACPDYQEYIGQLVNDLETPVILGAYRFPNNAAITELDAAAKEELKRDRLDPIHFGRWTN